MKLWGDTQPRKLSSEHLKNILRILREQEQLILHELKRRGEPVGGDILRHVAGIEAAPGKVIPSASATEVMVPIQCEYYALEGLAQLTRNVDLVRTNLNPELEISGIVMVMYDGRTRLAEQVERALQMAACGVLAVTIGSTRRRWMRATPMRRCGSGRPARPSRPSPWLCGRCVWSGAGRPVASSSPSSRGRTCSCSGMASCSPEPSRYRHGRSTYRVSRVKKLAGFRSWEMSGWSGRPGPGARPGAG